MKSFKLILKSTLFFALLATMSVAVSSCGDDEPEVIMGCTDSVGDNYNADATEDSGNCTYQGRFVGDWTGTFACTGALMGVFTAADLVVSKGVGDDDVAIIVVSQALGLQIPLPGTITRDAISIDQTLADIPLTQLMLPGLFDITATGTLTLDDAGTNISGDITFKLEETTLGGAVPTINDTCFYSADKQ